MIRAVVCDFGGVLTTPLGNAFAAWSQESGVPLEELGQAMAAAAHGYARHHLAGEPAPGEPDGQCAGGR